MSAIVPFDFNAPAPALAKPVTSALNKALLTSQGVPYPTLSIKGKVFTLVKDDTRKKLVRTLTNEDGTTEQVPMSSLPLTIVNGNGASRVYYEKGYIEGESDGQSPTCFSHDGKAPDAMAERPQAKNCQLCQHSKWGSKTRTEGGESKGTACAPRTRLAVADPNNPTTPFLLNLPPASRANLSAEIKKISAYGKEANEVAFRVAFDPDAPSPKLVFTAYGMLSDDALQKVQALKNDPVVLEIIGNPTPVDDAPAAAENPLPKLPGPAVTQDEVDGALDGTLAGANAAVQAAEATAAAKAAAGKPKAAAGKPKAEPKSEPVAAKTPAPAAGDGLGDLLGDLQGLLGATDD